MVQWLRLCTSPAEGADSTPGPGTEIPQAVTQPKIFKKTFFFKAMKQDPSPQDCLCTGTSTPGDRVDRVKEVLPIYLFFFLYVIDLVLLIDIKERIPLVKTNASRLYLLVHFYSSFQSFRSSNLHCPFYVPSLVFCKKFLFHYLLALKFCLKIL